MPSSNPNDNFTGTNKEAKWERALMMHYTAIQRDDYPHFYKLMVDYYREGEDADTPQEEIDGFIHVLFDMLMDHKIDGCFAME